MRLAFIVGSFPAISETFILDQITSLIDEGHTVDIYAEADPHQAVVHSDVDKYALRKRTHYYKPNNFALKIIKSAMLFVKYQTCDRL